MKLSLAPIQSYTHVFYRYAHHHTFGTFDRFFTPFFEEGKNGDLEPKIFPEPNPDLNSGMDVVPQVATNSGDFLIQTAKTFAGMGLDEINLNMGCPFPMLVKRKKGAGLLKKPTLVKSILTSFFNHTSGIKLSVKMRLGVERPDEWKDIIPIINDFPVSEVTVHPRTAKQKYKGEVNWAEFENITAACKHPLTGNGNINTKEDYLELQKRFSTVSSWMTGRGALHDPFLPGKIKGIVYTQEQKKLLFTKFHNTYLNIVKQNYPEWNHAFNLIRTFWHYPLQNNRNGQRFYKKLKKYLIEDEYSRWSQEIISNGTLMNTDITDNK